ncbi:MAG: EamA family transporter [Acidimicrobiia bacterium]|nr:EamA family transporter [Acidimicrobiia bacterium]
MTVVAPLTAIISAVVPVVAGVAGGERPSPLAAAGIVLAIVAVALVSGITGGVERATPVPVALMAVVAGVGFGLLFVFLDRTADDAGLWPLLIGQLTAVPIVAGYVAARRIRLAGFPRRYRLAMLAGVLAVTANVCYLLATRRGLLSLVAVITAMYPASTVMLATIVDHERLSRSQAAGLAAAVVALAMVTAGA